MTNRVQRTSGPALAPGVAGHQAAVAENGPSAIRRRALICSEIHSSETIRAQIAEKAGAAANRRIVLMLVEEGGLELDQSDARQRERHAVGAQASPIRLVHP